MSPHDSAPLRRRGALLLTTVFLTGMAVMVVEMAAVRALAPYFGASNYIWTNVIGVMLGALAVGYFLGGRVADRHPSLGVLYLFVLVGGLLCVVMPYAVRPLARWLVPADLGLETAAGHVFRASLIGTLVLFAPPTLLLGGVSPMVIKLLARPDRVGGAAGQVFAASTVGSIIGTFATTLYLIPLLGTRLTIGMAGALLAGTALVGLLVAAASRGQRVVAGVGTAAALILVFGFGTGDIKASPDRVTEVETAYQYVRVRDVTDDFGDGVRMLQINEAEQAYQSVRLSNGVLTGGRYYDYYSVLPLLLSAPDQPGLDCLVIGLAAGTIPMQLRHFYPQGLKVTGVEIDPGVLNLGYEYFGLPRDADWLDARVADGRVFLDSLPPRESLDLVIIDAFAQEYYIPFHLATEEAFSAAHDRLRPGGILAMNVSGFRSDELLIGVIEQTVAHVFGRAYRVLVDGYPNFMLFAVKGRAAPFGKLAHPPATGPAQWDELTRLAQFVAADAALVLPRKGALVLTDDRAPIERLTDELVRRESDAALGK